MSVFSRLASFVPQLSGDRILVSPYALAICRGKPSEYLLYGRAGLAGAVRLDWSDLIGSARIHRMA